ncbi:hypothetical protein B0T26DRAFT_747030 [Lasiosphaeria miniovina]|uniref:F-box domain-containing protein n=1 Tax=Lasiosphaeria miniovina TaxID=1954250 RepID=A0AA40ECR5_9PEZI|nr:uncharacterized protein B0T26DRAFT_747030 [Lasiosphaeria miniovina]KAK0735215.1 hypothetical protein B0T26DRAFT_747030 [Lasiosphaeria miniovina]
MNRLPSEVKHMVVQNIPDRDSKQALACVSREWQVVVERFTFEDLQVFSNQEYDEQSEAENPSVDEPINSWEMFKQCFSGGNEYRRVYLRHLVYRIVLAPYASSENDKEPESRLVRRRNDVRATHAVHKLLRFLSEWSPNLKSRLTLKMFAESPSDRQHWGPDNNNTPERTHDVTTPRPRRGLWYPDEYVYPGHRRWINSQLSILDHIPADSDPSDSDLNADGRPLSSVPLISTLHIGPYNGPKGRRFDPSRQVWLTSLMPELETTEWSGDHYGNPGICSHIHDDITKAIEKYSLPPTLKHLEFHFDHDRLPDPRVLVIPREFVPPSEAIQESQVIDDGGLPAALPDKAEEEPFWKELERLDVYFETTSPTGMRYFQFNTVPRSVAPIYYRGPLNNRPIYAAQSREDFLAVAAEEAILIQPRWSQMSFWGSRLPDDVVVVPFLQAFVQAITRMPKIRSACLHTLIPGPQRPPHRVLWGVTTGSWRPTPELRAMCLAASWLRFGMDAELVFLPENRRPKSAAKIGGPFWLKTPGSDPISQCGDRRC